MATRGEHDGATADDSFLAALTAGAQDRPESRVLDHLVGNWRTTTRWEPLVGRGIRESEGRIETRWIFGGRMLESCSVDDTGSDTARLLLGFDPTVGDYVAFTVTVLSSFFVLERGHHDPAARRLVLEGWEPRRDGEPAVRYRRTFELTDDDRYSVSISYPDVPLGTYGPMAIAHQRIG